MAEHQQLKQHSERMWEYEPMSVIRSGAGDLSVYSGEGLRELMRSDDKAQTLFYDVFRLRNGREVVALQASEFASEFGELSFSHGSNRIPARKEDVDQLAFKGGGSMPYLLAWRLALPEGADSIKVGTTAGDVVVDVPSSPFAGWKRTGLMLQTIQKDYPFEWIRDYCLFYHRAHGFKRIVLYDNGSANYAELLDRLAELDEGLELLVVSWPFPMFRPFMLERLETPHETIAQVAAFNHGFQMLGSLARYGANLDLDEYLYNGSGKDLERFISRNTVLMAQLHCYSVWVPNIPQPGHRQPVRAADFKHACREINYSFNRGKYLYKVGGTLLGTRVAYLLVHVAGIRSSKVSNFMNSLSSWLHQWFRLRKYNFNYTAQANPRDLRIYHYKGINTNWQLGTNLRDQRRRQMAGTLDSKRHVFNDAMAHLLKSVGLAD